MQCVFFCAGVFVPWLCTDSLWFFFVFGLCLIVCLMKWFVQHVAVTGNRLTETKFINKSLSALGNVTMALAHRDRGKHIPYRDSKLTYLLQPALTLHSKVIFFVTASPIRLHQQETLNTFLFGRRCRKIDLGPTQRRAELVPKKDQMKGTGRGWGMEGNWALSSC